MTYKFAIAALIAATAATSAQAQLPGGLRADIHSGWDHLSVHERTDVGVSGATTHQSEDGVIYGGEIGYDVSLGGVSLGVYGGLEGASTKKCAEVFTEVQTCAKAGRNWTLGARAGVNVTPAVLLYAKGGYSNGAVKFEYIDFVDASKSFTLSDNVGGYHLGAGVQVDVLRNFYVKAEYVRTDYADYTLRNGNATIAGGNDRDNVVFGVGVRF